jgi:hypothetical protein
MTYSYWFQRLARQLSSSKLCLKWRSTNSLPSFPQDGVFGHHSVVKRIDVDLLFCLFYDAGLKYGKAIMCLAAFS